MIAYLKGKIKTISERSAIIEAGGIGYEVYLVPLNLEKYKTGQVLEVYTHQYIREDLMELYGFELPEGLNFFKKLISVSGVGPKSALTIMSLASVAELQTAIVQEDASLLTKVSGIGQKTAERLIVELKSKIEAGDLSDSDASASQSGDGQIIDGLVGLGYSAKEARDAIRLVDKSVVNVNDRLKQALKLLGKTD